MSKEYTGAIIILVMSALKLGGIEIAETEVATIITGVVALVIAIARYYRGGITPLGARVV